MILYYVGTQDELKIQVIDLLKECQYPYKLVGDDVKDQTIEILLTKDIQSDALGNQEPFLLLDGLSREDVEAFHKKMVEKELYIPRKAIRTETNSTWTLQALMEEVDREYNYFLLRDTLYDLVTHPNKEKLNSNPDYLTTMSMAYALLEDQETEAELLQVAIQTIQKMNGQ